MARYKIIDTSPRFLPVDLQKQLVPGTFEHALDWLIDHEFDLTPFDARYKNDGQGAPAYPPGMLLKVVLFAYSRSMISSRAIERACREQVTFIALSGDEAPHFTTFADFVSRLGEHIVPLFAKVLYLCGQQGLIGREMFAIDGVKLPSNASKAKSGTRAEFLERAAKLEKAAEAMLARHRAEDTKAETPMAEKDAKRVERLQQDAKQMRAWLKANPKDRPGAKGGVRKSNLTDNESAKMATSKGVIQGYCGVAVVDAKHQIVMEAQAHGTGSEQELLVPVVNAIVPLMAKGEADHQSRETCKDNNNVNDAFPANQAAPTGTLITADAGYHSEANLAALAAMNINALIADNLMRQRDERFADQGKHQSKPDPLHDKGAVRKDGLFRPIDFTYDAMAGTCVCPAGKSLHSCGTQRTANGRQYHKFQGGPGTCSGCAQRTQCLRHPDKTPARQVAFFTKNQPSPLLHTQRMKERIDSDEGRRLYGDRFSTVEPVFGNLRHNKGLDRFTLRGRTKVDGQWKLYCMVQNIEKLARSGYAMPQQAARRQ
jgi:transposase